jgi:sec-independent protein translocase protein TatA
MGLVYSIGGSEILLVLVAVLLLFGSKSIPEFARTLGKGMNEVKKATDEIKREINNEVKGLSDEVKNMNDKINPDI